MKFCKRCLFDEKNDKKKNNTQQKLLHRVGIKAIKLLYPPDFFEMDILSKRP